MAKSDWILPAATAAIGAYGAYSASRNRREDREDAREENDLDRRYQAAVRESELNPYRHHLAQAQSLGALDLIARGAYTPPQISVPGVKAPTITGGFEYTANPDMAEAAKRLQGVVASGRGAPSMTDPNNWGQTGGLDLNTMGGPPPAPGTAVPRGGTSATPTRAPGASGFDPTPLLAGVARRNEGAGGVGGGAVKGGLAMSKFGPWAMAGGALVGGAIGAMTKNAKTAATDISVEDARQIIAQQIQETQGRSPSPDEITEMLRGQGWQPGHRWVGEASLLYVLRQLQRQATPQAALAPSYDSLFDQ
jgi:hypothetical protein